MNLLQILDNIYSDNEDLIASVIARSIYSTEYKPDKDKSIIINTGLSFTPHKGKEFNLFYDIGKNQLIRQPATTWDLVGLLPRLGLYCFVENGYINRYSTDLIVGISDDNKSFLVESIDNKDYSTLSENYPKFIIYKADDQNDIIRSYPVSVGRKLLVFMWVHAIERFISDEEYKNAQSEEDYEWEDSDYGFEDDYDRYNSRYYSDEDAFRDATDGQCEGESWTSLGRD